eukprot:1160088-Pelagomonas_calceolata.AAC.11
MKVTADLLLQAVWEHLGCCQKSMIAPLPAHRWCIQHTSLVTLHLLLCAELQGSHLEIMGT